MTHPHAEHDVRIKQVEVREYRVDFGEHATWSDQAEEDLLGLDILAVHEHGMVFCHTCDVELDLHVEYAS
jgi:hypothetical protein